jgi:hypothetical protein
VGPLSFFIIGLCAGMFIMAFHVSTYVFHSLHFPFLATLKRPLYRFAINNSVFPISFLIFYSFNIYRFEQFTEFTPVEALINIAALLTGSFVIIGLVFSYFFSTIRPLDPPVKGSKPKGLGWLAGRMKVSEIDQLKEEVVYAYLRNPFNIRLARNAKHYAKDLMIKTIHRHHLSAVAFAILLLIIIISMGFFGDRAWMEIPAGGTVFLILSLGLMLYTILFTWFKSWTPLVLILFIIIIDQSAKFSQVHPAFGMNYDPEKAVLYNDSVFEQLIDQEQIEADQAHWTSILKEWKAKTKEKKPLLILLNVSGGGLRSSVFAYEMWRELDKLTDGKFSQHTVLVTGASGGMFGAAYYRELYGNRWLADSARQKALEEGRIRVAKDLLNPTAFHLFVNDLLFRLRRVDIGGLSYAYDRGYAFDQQLVENTQGILSGAAFSRQQVEREAIIPSLILSPTIVNDGRRLLISPHPSSFLCTVIRGKDPKAMEMDGLEMRSLFSQTLVDSLRYATSIRMSASFPYITPLIEMPSEPGLELIDAGVRDNDGFELSLRFLESMQPWINKNCSGVMVVRLRGDRQEQVEISEKSQSWTSKWLRPVDGVVRSFTNLQTYGKVAMREHTKEWGIKPAFRDYYLFQQKDNYTLSWHLTSAEKERIREAVFRLGSDSTELAYWQWVFW